MNLEYPCLCMNLYKEDKATLHFLAIERGIMTVAKFTIVAFFTCVFAIALEILLYGFFCRLFNLFSVHILCLDNQNNLGSFLSLIISLTRLISSSTCFSSCLLSFRTEADRVRKYSFCLSRIRVTRSKKSFAVIVRHPFHFVYNR